MFSFSNLDTELEPLFYLLTLYGNSEINGTVSVEKTVIQHQIKHFPKLFTCFAANVLPKCSPRVSEANIQGVIGKQKINIFIAWLVSFPTYMLVIISKRHSNWINQVITQQCQDDLALDRECPYTTHYMSRHTTNGLLACSACCKSCTLHIYRYATLLPSPIFFDEVSNKLVIMQCL